jgi:arylsulfatase A-like enzyme
LGALQNGRNGPARQGSPRQVGSTNGLPGYKLSINEGGIRVPGLLVWPEGVAKPLTMNAPCVTSDYFPTILDALGIPLPEDRIYDGISLMPLLRGERQTRGRPIGFLNREGKEQVWMDDQYKLIVGRNQGLFDITADPTEKNDLSKKRPEVEKRMKAELSEWKDGVMKELKTVTP